MIHNLKTTNRQLLIIFLLSFALISIPFLTSPDLSSGIKMLRLPPFQKSFLSYILLVCFLNLNYYYYVPFFYIKKKWISFIILIILSYVIILQIPNYLINSAPPNLFTPKNSPDFPYMKMPTGIFSKDSYFFQFLVTFLLSLFFRIEQYLNKIKNDKLISETFYLKEQIKPHFLFNTLNSLYALTLTKSDEAPKAILKLSNLMRYTVSESNQTHISLQKEIDHIKNFIDLQKLRITNKITLITNFEGEFSNAKISSFILINFIENAFKYGVNGENASTISITVRLDKQKCLFLNVENTIVPITKNYVESTKKGIENTKKRLEVFYPNKYNLLLSTQENTYKVKLVIELE